MAIDINAMKMKIAELNESLEKSLPNYAGILGVIHSEMRNQPELIYMLADEEIATIVSGLSHHHKVEIIEPKNKKKIPSSRGKNMSADDV